VQRVGARFRCDIEDAAGRAAVLGGVCIREHGEFLHRLDAADDPLRAAGAAPERIQNVGAVEHVRVLRRARAVHRHLRALSGEDVADVAPGLRGARLQQNQLREIAAVERQALDLLPADELPERGAARFYRDVRRSRRDADRFGDRLELQRQIDLRVLADGELDDEPRRTKAGQFRRDLVLSDVLAGKRVATAIVGDGGAALVHGDRTDRHRGARQHRPGAVLDDAGNGGVAILRLCARSGDKCREESDDKRNERRARQRTVRQPAHQRPPFNGPTFIGHSKLRCQPRA
jgi:hypothetical protein